MESNTPLIKYTVIKEIPIMGYIEIHKYPESMIDTLIHHMQSIGYTYDTKSDKVELYTMWISAPGVDPVIFKYSYRRGGMQWKNKKIDLNDFLELKEEFRGHKLDKYGI